MGKTFIASLSVADNYNQETLQYCRKIDISLPALNERESHALAIEVRDMPEIITFVEHMEHSRQPPNDVTWQIHRISDEGITLDLVTHNGSRREDVKWKEGYIFIPMENVIAIHNVDHVFLDSVSKLSTQNSV